MLDKTDNGLSMKIKDEKEGKEEVKFEIDTDAKCSKQPNSYDCGIYLCIFMFYAYQGFRIPIKITSESKVKRRYLKKALVEADITLLKN